MVFSSNVFLFVFLPLTVLVYYIIPQKFRTLRNLWLFLMSLAFLAIGSVYSMSIMVTSILINYASGMMMARFGDKPGLKKLFLIIPLVLNLGLLFYFKYTTFFLTSLYQVFRIDREVVQILLPIGISFFIFQGLSYVIDLYRGEVAVQKNPLNVALYIALFPQLIAGPIVRYSHVEYEILHRKESLDLVYEGVQRFIVGLSKKMLLANPLAEVVDKAFSNVGFLGTDTAWFALLCYGLQIYFDFSGYSDMAIGLGKIFGFHFNENFNLPYISRSLSEFWKRWHISLSTWFRDYLYIPLGGNRHGNEYVNLLIVFVATGLWHGASSRYLLWGLWHGAFLMLEHCLRKRKKAQGKELRRPGLWGFLYTNFVVLISWLPFRADTFGVALDYGKRMIGIEPEFVRFSLGYYLNNYTGFIFAVACLIALNIPQTLLKKFCTEDSIWVKFVKPVLLLPLFALCIVYLVNGTFNPFIYFQF